MITTIEIHVRHFPVRVYDHRTGYTWDDFINLTGEQLQACRLVGQSSTELIERMCERKGLTAIEIGTPTRHTITLELEALLRQYKCQDGRPGWEHLYGGGVE